MYVVSPAEAKSLLQSLKIHHPYGVIGGPTWSADGIGFGCESARLLEDLSSNVRTYSEGIENEVDQETIKKAIESADLVAFLGFSFHPRNLDILAPRRLGNVKKIIGTRNGISDVAAENIKRRLMRGFFKETTVGSPIDLADLNCFEFMRQYRAALSGT